uniref:Uncharacterized protein n=1 Tax=Candidatus Methanogaster sp. ANME-2c ERB4 TaxID=2759911 RepID=A0A7G9Y981_9EURY|nr:hypothetical protein KKOBALHG_00002 [Methanosarcinales archaeon ANME-2c ERB4]QNO45096.1 hypothetical protein HICMJNBA_00002 [Methanosarcinales archaeon ANME-2c ERB4]
MKKLTEVEKKRFWEEVQSEFPDDEMMQEVHYVRLMHHRLTENLSREERLRFYGAV